MGSRDSFLQAMKNLRDSGQAKPEEEEVQTNVAQEESVPAVIPEPEAESEVHTEDYGYENQSETSSVNSFYGDVYAQPASKTVISKGYFYRRRNSFYQRCGDIWKSEG